MFSQKHLTNAWFVSQMASTTHVPQGVDIHGTVIGRKTMAIVDWDVKKSI